MRKINIIYVGKSKEQFWRGAAEEYVKRISAYAEVKFTEIPAENIPDTRRALEKESQLILKRIPRGYTCIAMCVEGIRMSSERFAETISDNNICFVIGGSHGLHGSVKSAADLCLSLSEMTIAHEPAKIFLLEQIYRAFTIINGKKYHK